MSELAMTEPQLLPVFGPAALPDAVGEAAAQGVLQITLSREGRFMVRGPRVAVTAFLAECARSGLVIHLDSLNWCG